MSLSRSSTLGKGQLTGSSTPLRPTNEWTILTPSRPCCPLFLGMHTLPTSVIHDLTDSCTTCSMPCTDCGDPCTCHNGHEFRARLFYTSGDEYSISVHISEQFVNDKFMSIYSVHGGKQCLPVVHTPGYPCTTFAGA
jgi:hypothetical protein